MQLTGPLFLLIFLPLSFLAVLPFRRRRAAVLTVLSLVWYILANLQTPFAIPQVLFVLILALLLTLPKNTKTAACVGIPLFIGLWLAARITAEYGNTAYTFPIGFTLICMSAISLLADRALARTRTATVFEVTSYLLFYPCLLLGPVLRFSTYLDLCDSAGSTLPRFAKGVHAYIEGYIKRIALSALLLRTLDEILRYDLEELPLVILLLILPVAYFFLYFFLTGSTSLARGVMLMYGMEPPPDHRRLFSSPFPDDMATGMFLSLGSYLTVYIKEPICRRLQGRCGRMLGTLAAFLAGVGFFRLSPSLLLLACPIGAFALWRAWREKPLAAPRSRLYRLPLALFSALCCALFAIGLSADHPLALFDIFHSNTWQISYQFYYLYGVLSGARYLMVGVIAALVCFPLSRLNEYLHVRLQGRKLLALHIVKSTLLFAGFFFTLLYFMPQFPEYAVHSLARLYI